MAAKCLILSVLCDCPAFLAMQDTCVTICEPVSWVLRWFECGIGSGVSRSGVWLVRVLHWVGMCDVDMICYVPEGKRGGWDL